MNLIEMKKAEIAALSDKFLNGEISQRQYHLLKDLKLNVIENLRKGGVLNVRAI